MVAKTSIKTSEPIAKTLIINTSFYEALSDVLNYGIEKFGATASLNFYNKVFDEIKKLSVFYNANPKNRFISSSEKKVFRNILIKKYAILYSVTTRIVRVITIYHTAINPKIIKTHHFNSK